MGLGPPVCERCKVPGTFNIVWRCPVCNSVDLKWHAWDCGLTEEELDANLRFLLFMKGPKDGEEGDGKWEATTSQG